MLRASRSRSQQILVSATPTAQRVLSGAQLLFGRVLNFVETDNNDR